MEREAVIDASNILEISDYDLFVTAYGVLFNREPDETTISDDYGRYMWKGEVPFYVEGYIREIGTLEA
jgi:hypothetical protein